MEKTPTEDRPFFKKSKTLFCLTETPLVKATRLHLQNARFNIVLVIFIQTGCLVKINPHFSMLDVKISGEVEKKRFILTRRIELVIVSFYRV